MNELISNAPEADEPMQKACQIWLFSPARPLVERFGHTFFRAIPRLPGVYIMHGQGGRPRRPRVLYVGKAKDLRRRLGSYRQVHPDRDSRKTLRLVHQVEEIKWEICADESAALLRENELLRQHRPLYNRVNVRPEAHGCIGLRCEHGVIEFRQGAPDDEDWKWFGSFKAGRKLALGALLRLLVQANQLAIAWQQIPHCLLADRAPSRFSLETNDGETLLTLLRDYFTGRSWELVDSLAAILEPRPTIDPFLNNWREADLEMIRTFYLNGPRRNRRWREQLGLPDTRLLLPEDLDDLPVRVKLVPEPSPWEATNPEAGVNSMTAIPVVE